MTRRLDTMTRRLDTMASSLLLIRWRWRRCNDAAGAADWRQRWRSSSCGMAETKAAGVSGGWAEAFRLCVGRERPDSPSSSEGSPFSQSTRLRVPFRYDRAESRELPTVDSGLDPAYTNWRCTGIAFSIERSRGL